MLVTPVECIGLARIVYVNAGACTYEFANGFDTGTPDGAVAGSAPIVVNGDGDFTIFLDTPQDLGAVAQQGGIACVANVSNVTGAPGAAWVTCEYAPALAGNYAAVEPTKAIRLRAYTVAGNPGIPTLIDASLEITLAVYRNVQTLFPHP